LFCELASILAGRLFHTPGQQSEKARRPNWFDGQRLTWLLMIVVLSDLVFPLPSQDIRREEEPAPK